jgi:putative acetyltransferase
MTALVILPADLGDARVAALLATHAATARAETAAGSAHALDLDGLKAAGMMVWAAWRDGALVGVGALKRLSATEGEVKSMHTAIAARRAGVGRAMLDHIVAAAERVGLARLSLETGSWPYFEPARALYASAGFTQCGPFSDYVADPNSVFMTRVLGPPASGGRQPDG